MLSNKKVAMYLVLVGSMATGTTSALAADSNATIEMVDQGGGVLKQVVTGLEWAQSDNGSDIDWNNAGKYCSGKGSGWRLPSVAELRSLYDRSAKVNTNCGSGFSCRVSPLFRLTGPWDWSNEANNSLSSWFVTLTNGTPNTYSVSDPAKKRALCVRSS